MTARQENKRSHAKIFIYFSFLFIPQDVRRSLSPFIWSLIPPSVLFFPGTSLPLLYPPPRRYPRGSPPSYTPDTLSPPLLPIRPPEMKFPCNSRTSQISPAIATLGISHGVFLILSDLSLQNTPRPLNLISRILFPYIIPADKTKYEKTCYRSKRAERTTYTTTGKVLYVCVCVRPNNTML
jgi:hypothetical protein